LAKVGFAIPGSPSNADNQNYARTTVRYDPRASKSLETLKASLPNAEFVSVEGLGNTFVVIAGPDWTGAQKVTVRKSGSSGTGSADDTKDGVTTTTAAKSICT
jgi:hypothetical protein